MLKQQIITLLVSLSGVALFLLAWNALAQLREYRENKRYRNVTKYRIACEACKFSGEVVMTNGVIRVSPCLCK